LSEARTKNAEVIRLAANGERGAASEAEFELERLRREWVAAGGRDDD
jgi:hypothetical protein